LAVKDILEEVVPYVQNENVNIVACLTLEEQEQLLGLLTKVVVGFGTNSYK